MYFFPKEASLINLTEGLKIGSAATAYNAFF
jgi:hypothetical protein